jgi:hypothetical protein
MKQKLAKYDENGLEKTLLDKDAKSCNFSDYVYWIEGKPIINNYSKRQIDEYKESDIICKDGKLYPHVGAKIWFSVSFREDINNYIFVDFDFKALEVEDDVKDKFKQEIIDTIILDSELISRVRSVVKSGNSSNNGLHILLYSKRGFNNKSASASNFVRYLTTQVSPEFSPLFLVKGFNDSSSSTTKRWMKTIYGIGFSHLNLESDWNEDVTIQTNHKLYVPETYESGFHSKLSKWIYNTTLTKEEILQLYVNDYNKKPFKKDIIFKEELERLLIYLNKTTKAHTQLIKEELFYTDEKGKDKLDINHLANKLFLEYDFIKDSSDFIYLKKKTSYEWISFYRDRQLNRWDFIPMIIKEYNINDISKEKQISQGISEILSLRELSGDLPKRDLDTRDSAVFIIRNKQNKVSQIKVTKDKVDIINKEYIKGTDVKVPVDEIDLSVDWKEWPLYKSGFFRNVVSNEEEYFKIIGFINHMDPSTANGLRFVIHSDSTEDKQGGTGKTLATKAATYLRKKVEVKYNPSSASDTFFLQNCDTTTNILYIDEFPKEGNIEFFRDFYNPNKKYVNKKFKEPIAIDPVKLIISTNYNLSESNPDKERRVEVSFKRYYNRATNPVSKSLGGYQAFDDTRLINDKFFINDFGEKIDCNLWWNQYICFIIHCVQLYLSDVSTRFTDMVDNKSQLLKKHEDYLENTYLSKLYTEIITNIDNITKDNQSSYSIRNSELCDILVYKGKTLKIIPHMIETYISYFTNYNYDSKTVDRQGVIHHIKKKTK